MLLNILGVRPLFSDFIYWCNQFLVERLLTDNGRFKTVGLKPLGEAKKAIDGL